MWKDIVGFEGYYQISDDGVVKSLERTVKTKTGIRTYGERILKQEICNSGYCRVTLAKEGEKHRELVHRLVAIHFIENPLNKREVNHIDGNKRNNNVSNLEWATSSENQSHAYAMGLQDIQRTKEANSKSVIMYDKSTNDKLKRFNSMVDASSHLNIPVNVISYHCNTMCRPRKYDFYFRFAD
jgi:hypothetical protein